MDHDGGSAASRLMAPVDSGKEMAQQLSSTVATLTASSVPGSITMVTMVGIIVAILVAIAILFALGIFIDCRHQRLIDEKIDSSGRKRSRHTGSIRQFFTRSQPRDVESSTIVDDMEDNSRSIPPVANESVIA